MDAKERRLIKTKKFFARKRKKTTITFDADDRREFLTGFQKRKANRKIKAKEEQKIEYKKERIRLRQKRKENLDKLMESQRSVEWVPEVETILAENTVTYDLPKQTVSITTFDAKEVSGSLGLSLGHNNDQNVTKTDRKLTKTDRKFTKTDRKVTKTARNVTKTDRKSNKKKKK